MIEWLGFTGIVAFYLGVLGVITWLLWKASRQ